MTTSLKALWAITILGGACFAQRVSESAQASRLRELNTSVLQLPGESQRFSGNANPQAFAVLEERAEALGRLMETNPAEALSLAFSDEAIESLLRAFPKAKALLETNLTFAVERVFRRFSASDSS